MNADFAEIIKYAAKAPSGHNTQPWKFKITDDQIVILPDYAARLPVVDKDNRELFISLGCAVENLVISASYYGYLCQITGRSEAGINISLIKGNNVASGNLFRQIEKRQTNRNIYSGKKITDNTLETLKSILMEPGTGIYFYETGSAAAHMLKEYVNRGNNIQMNDRAFKNELLSWMRFNAKHESETNNGLSYRVFGNPPLPRIIARHVVNCFLKPRTQNKSDMGKIDSSSHLVLFTIRDNRHETWIDLGRTLQRFLLTATGLEIACAFLNQPCEIGSLAAEIQESLSINKEYPVLLLRIGYSEQLPYSPRKNIESLLT